MSSKRTYFALLGLIGLLIIALPAGAYEADSLLTSHAQVSLKARSEALDQEQESFKIAQNNIKKYSGLEKIAKAIVPQDKSQAEAVREIVRIAAANGVDLASITFPPSTLGGPSGPAAAGSTSSSGTTTGASSSSTAPAANLNSSQNRFSQLVRVTGIPGVYQQTITVTSDSNNPILYNQLINFLSGLEQNRRTAQVNSININPVGSGRYLTFVITLNEYIKP